MGNESGEWIMQGLAWDDPDRIRSWRELIAYVQEVGFLPLFRNEAVGFSAEERVSPLFWWTGDPEQDPWEWRKLIARSGEVAYGKFFGRKAGFISKEWFPHFANWRRDGYDFDTRWEEALTSVRCKRIMDCFGEEEQWFSNLLKSAAGFGKNGEKNFDGVVTDLQMNAYLVIRDFRRRLNRQGLEYGWPVTVYTTPEALWGYEHIASAYHIDPEASGALIRQQVESCFSDRAFALLQSAGQGIAK